MLKEYAAEWIQLGEDIESAKLIWLLDENFEEPPFSRRESEPRLNAAGKAELLEELRKLLKVAKKLDLPVSLNLLGRRVGYESSLPETRQEFDLLVEALKDEVATKLFFFVPSYRASYYGDSGLSLVPETAFPKADIELKLAGNCYAFGEPTAAVFHAMRAAEIGIRTLATALGVTFSAPIEMMEWQSILNAITPKIRDIENQPKSAERKADQEFFGMAAAQLMFFKNGWRIHAAHAGDLFSPGDAKEAIDHVRNFFETLAHRELLA